MAEAAAKGAEVVCLPELYRSPYFCQKEDHALFDLAEPVPGPSTEALGKVGQGRGVVVVAPIFEKRALGLYHNSAAIIDATGEVVGLYRKMHIPDDPLFYEKFYFTPGDLGFQAFDTKAGRLGTLICWDQWYPEGARLTALRGAAVLFYPTAIGWHPHEKEQYGAAQRSAWQTIQRCHAIANGVYVAVVNRVGHEKQVDGRAGPRVLGHLVPGRSFRRRDRRRLDRQGGDPGGRGGPRPHGGGAPQLAFPPRPPHRRLRRPRPPLPRLTCRPHGRAAASPRRAVPHARRVGAARGHLDRLAPPAHRLAGTLRADPLGLRGDRAQALPRESGADPGALARPRGRGAPGPGSGGRRPRRASSSCAGPPTAAGPATSARSSSSGRPAGPRSRSRASASTAGPSTPTGRKTRTCRRSPRRPSACACCRCVAKGQRRRPRGRQHRRERRGHPAHDRGVPARPRRAGSQPRLRQVGLCRGLPGRARRHARDLARQGDRGGRHPRPRRRPVPLRESQDPGGLPREGREGREPRGPRGELGAPAGCAGSKTERAPRS